MSRPHLEHPRSRGEDFFRLVSIKALPETPPLARGRHLQPLLI